MTQGQVVARSGWRQVAAVKGGTLSDLWLYLRYQLLSKLLVAVLVMPLYRLVMDMLIASTGRTSITSGDFTSFALSLQGVGLAVVTVALLGLIVVLDIAAFVIAELARLRGVPIRTGRELLLAALRAVPRFLHPATLLFLLYLAGVVPLAGMGPRLSILSWVKIPNFVLDVVLKNPLYLSLYVVVLVVLGVLAFFLIMTVQAMFASDLNPWQAMGASMKFVKRHWWAVLVTLARGFVLLGGAILGVAAILIAVLFLVILVLPENVAMVRFSYLLFSLVLASAAGLLLLVVAPIQLRNLTRAWVVLNETVPTEQREDVRAADRRDRPRLIIAGAVAALVGVACAAVGTAFFQEIFVRDRDIAVIAHRGGGDLDAENSLEGLEAAIAAGSKWSEIDIQRTRDGAYVVNHDATFARLSGVKKASSEMTLAEIQQLSIANTFTPGQPARAVPTIEQMMDTAKGRIGLFVELKGATADQQMADDMVKLIKERGELDSVALISLDHALISYVENTYPEVITGYLYYFGVGDVANLNFDYLIIEEGVATSSKVEELQASGRKVVVWTVNTEESIDRFAGSQVDGIITDVPVKVSEGIAAKRSRDDLDRIADAVFEE
ncbi:MAG: glycerophosphodiester phosphodiesterase family protein [Propionibacteriaceae bacterium]|nr:glycerophosphodiester phosphodiesterase family protein [Propionibacteriaceae bacterium]